jgi:flavin-dependent dehydrogenase
MKIYDYAILGGGIAGLCAAKRLLELGFAPLVIEGGGYPSHKVCGEFLSPSILPALQKWNIHPVLIHQMQWHSSSQYLQFSFQSPAASLSHWVLDSQLADQITQEGGSLLTHTKVVDLFPSTHERECHRLLLSSGEKIGVRHLLIGAGRVPHPSLHPPSLPYIGFKAHFSGLTLDSTLHMFSLKGAYLGVSPIENGKANVACLVKKELLEPGASPEKFMHQLISSHPSLCKLLGEGTRLFDHWMVTPVPEFGWRGVPDWMQTYWIGDAAGTIPPASGSGLTLAITGGCLAAEFAARRDASGFKKVWKKRCLTQIRYAKALHKIFLNPLLSVSAMQLCRQFPWAGHRFLSHLNLNLSRDR